MTEQGQMAKIEDALLSKTDAELTRIVNQTVSKFYLDIGIMTSWAKSGHTKELGDILKKIVAAHRTTIHEKKVREFVSTYQNLLQQYPELQAMEENEQ